MINGLLINQLICYFAIYSFIGWCVEVVYTSYLSKKFINRGFLFGPFCPIYGYSIITVLIILNNFVQTPLLFLIGATIITTIIEYLTGVILETVFKTRWWDYSKRKFNLGGKICLKFSIYWGFALFFVYYFIHPYINLLTINLLQKTNFLFPTIFVIYLTIDTIFSIISAYGLRKIIIRINKLKEEYQNNLEEFAEKRNEIYFNLKKRQRFLLKYLPTFKIPKIRYLKKK